VLRDAGLAVPDDIAITSIDNDYFAENATPRLTTVEQPSVEVGRTMARLLVDRIEGRDVAQVTILPTRLIAGASA
jgi:LacI family transcriptional regulator